MKGFYVHIPFCEYICHYCDFVKSVPKNADVIDRYLLKLRDEIMNYQNHFDSIETIFIGGGTPSMLSVDQLTFLFDSLKAMNPIEYSIELNPESYTHEKGLLFKKYGINRISIGVQSFDDDILKYINRGHKTEKVYEVIADLKQIGIPYLSVDLIFAIPGQTIDHIKRDLEHLVKLDVSHVSYYSLILEDKTYFYHQYLRGNFEPMDEDMEAKMYSYIQKRLEELGYEHYEISNYARDGHYSLHNNIYWTLGEYIGVGLGAHGFIDNYRTYNERSMTQYLDHFQKEKTYQTDELKLQDELIFGLRKTRGIDLTEIKRKYDVDVFEKYPKLYEKMELGLVQVKDDYLSLTKAGVMLGNQVFVLFI